jgi:hypothetical protein
LSRHIKNATSKEDFSPPKAFGTCSSITQVALDHAHAARIRLPHLTQHSRKCDAYTSRMLQEADGSMK